MLSLLHGTSQIFFHTKTVPGLLILAAFAVADWRMAILVLLGSAGSSLAGLMLRVPAHEVRNGHQGFCGALVGAAAYASLGSGWLGVLGAVVGGVACAPVTWVLVRVFDSRPLRRYKLPYTTAPFCIIGGLMLLATAGHHVSEAIGEIDDSLRTDFFRSLLTNISEVVLIDNVVAGGLILLALFLIHWKVGLAAVLGSVLQTFLVLLLHEDAVSLGQGVLGYSGVLVAIAMAAVFLKGTWQPWVMAVAGTVLACLFTLVVQDLHGVYTWPYVITTWVLLVVSRYIPGVDHATHEPLPG
ncbi:urea transporter [Arthrobacter sp. STN4]|uniref:urea transporter n=1 Tax=Arthrobacter sp. STN4 TaxID=2923276 RepID=UPI00211A656C|nr:urea transporter [Arthrobacter sp. STN4]MCQ9164934.1 urea transporter [Arthrobacter sp. STN4]